MREKFFKWMSVPLFMLVLAVIGMTACSSDQEPSGSTSGSSSFSEGELFKGIAEESTSPEYEDLLYSLEDYSSAFMSDQSVSHKKKSWWSRFKESVCADFGGGSKGGVIFSLGASQIKWNQLNREHTQQMADAILDDPTKRRKVKHDVDSLKQSYLSNPNNYGALHNMVILQSLLDGELMAESTEQVVRQSLRSLQVLGFSRFATSTSVTELTMGLDDFFAKYYDDDVSVMYDKLTAAYPKRADEFKVLKTYFTNIQALNSVETIQNYTTGYVSVINASKLTVDAKEELYKNISIAPASCQLWMEIEKLLLE